MTTPSPPKPYEQSRSIAPAPTVLSVAHPSNPEQPITSPQPVAAPQIQSQDKLTNDYNSTFNSQFQATLAPPQPFPQYPPQPYPTQPYSSQPYPPQLGMSPYGMNPYVTPYNRQPFNPFQSMMYGMQMSVSSLGRLSQLLQISFDAIHMSMTSVLRLVEHAFLLRTEVSGILGTVNIWKYLKNIISSVMSKLRSFFTGQISEQKESKLPTVPSDETPKNGYGDWGLISGLISVAVLWSFIKWLKRKFFPSPVVLDPEEYNPTTIPPPQPFQQNDGYGSNMYGMNNMYGNSGLYQNQGYGGYNGGSSMYNSNLYNSSMYNSGMLGSSNSMYSNPYNSSYNSGNMYGNNMYSGYNGSSGMYNGFN